MYQISHVIVETLTSGWMTTTGTYSPVAEVSTQ
jgi:hypothetical protein